MPHGAFYCRCTWKQAQKITLRQSIPQKRILFQSSVVTGNGVIFLFCLLLFGASISASLKIARGLFCCCLLLEVRNSCAESYRCKQLKFLSPLSLNYSMWHRLFIALKGLQSPHTCLETQVLDNHICTLAVSLQFSVDFYLVPKGIGLCWRGKTHPRTGTQHNCFAELETQGYSQLA